MVSDFYFLTTDLARRNTGTFIRLQRKPKNIYLFPCHSVVNFFFFKSQISNSAIQMIAYLNPKSKIPNPKFK